MNGNERSAAPDSDPDTAPDLSVDGWPEKFARRDRWGSSYAAHATRSSTASRRPTTRNARSIWLM